MIAVFQSSSLQVVFQCFQHEKQCGSGWWRALMQPWSECLALSVCPACSTFLCMLRWEGNPAPRVISQWDKQGRVSGLTIWELCNVSLSWRESGQAYKSECWSKEQCHQENLKIQENWWPLLAIPVFLCLLLEAVGWDALAICATPSMAGMFLPGLFPFRCLSSC